MESITPAGGGDNELFDFHLSYYHLTQMAQEGTVTGRTVKSSKSISTTKVRLYGQIVHGGLDSRKYITYITYGL